MRRRFQNLALIASFIVSLAAFAADDFEPNGAVPGLMPPLMELQFGARMEGKTLFQLGEILVAYSPRLLENGGGKLAGVVEGIEVRGKADDSKTWKFKGLEREVAPIRAHISALTGKILQKEALTAQQIVAIKTWLAKFDAADQALRTEPSIDNLDALSEVLLDVGTPFRAVDRPEVRLLEAVMEASTLNKRSYIVADYFSRVIEEYQKKSEGYLELKLTLDGVTLDPAVAMGESKGQELAGMKERYAAWIERIRADLQPFTQAEAPLLKGQSRNIAKLVSDADKLLEKLNSGNWIVLLQLQDFSSDAQAPLFVEPALAPAALRLQVSNLVAQQSSFLNRALQGIRTGRQQGANSLTLRHSDLECKIDIRDVPQMKFTNDTRRLSDHFAQTQASAQTVLRVSKVGAEHRAVLEKAITALENARGALKNETPYNKWVDWSKDMQALIALYKF